MVCPLWLLTDLRCICLAKVFCCSLTCNADCELCCMRFLFLSIGESKFLECVLWLECLDWREFGDLRSEKRIFFPLLWIRSCCVCGKSENLMLLL